jgi:hypothetical protein
VDCLIKNLNGYNFDESHKFPKVLNGINDKSQEWEKSIGPASIACDDPSQRGDAVVYAEL